jgi:hypothetical protein
VTYYVIEIEVTASLKGDGPKKLEVLYVRCWQRREKSKGPDVSNGQDRIPAVSDRVRAYLKRARDGGYDLLESNGIGQTLNRASEPGPK